MTTVVRAYVDVVSAYSYIVIQRLDRLVAAHDAVVDWQLVSLPHILKAAGGQSPLDQPLKARHNAADWARRCALHDLPALLPEHRPIEAALARRLFHRIKRHSPESAGDVLRALSSRVFGLGQPIGSAEDLGKALAAAGLDHLMPEVPRAATDDQAAEDLRRAGEWALQDGMFGAPFVVVGDARFWGSDQLDAIDRHLSRHGDRPDGFDEIQALSGFPHGFGPVFRRVSGQQVTLALRITTRHANPAGIAHGGLLATLADMAAGAQLAHQTGSRPGIPTVSLTVDYMRPVPLGAWLQVSARILRMGSRIGVFDGSGATDAGQVLRFSGTVAPPPAGFSSNEIG